MRARVAASSSGDGASSIDLLVAALQAAFALAEVDDVAVRVGEHLHLDVPGRSARIARGTVCRPRTPRPPRAVRDASAGGSSAGSCDHPHALAATAGRRLDQHRVADVAGRRDRVRRRSGRAGRCPGTTGTPNADTVALARDLVAHRLDGRDRRPDEHDARASAQAARIRRSPKGIRSPGGRPARRCARAASTTASMSR